MSRVKVPLINENHPENYNGYPFITLLNYRDQNILTIVDNYTKKQIKAFILDLCSAEKVDEHQFVMDVSVWYNKCSKSLPLSIYLNQQHLMEKYQPIYKSFNVDYIKRAIGPLPQFNMDGVIGIRRKKRKTVPPGVIVNKHTI